jgi:hypothetical protein
VTSQLPSNCSTVFFSAVASLQSHSWPQIFTFVGFRD